MPYQYYHSKKIARLMLVSKIRDELFKYCLDNNVLELDSRVREKELIYKIHNRLSLLDNFLLDAFVNMDTITSKFILLYAIMKEDLLFFEFMFEVYREALLNGKGYISVDDFDNFFNIKADNNPSIEKWVPYTKKQISKAYRNVLRESSFGENYKRNIKITPQVVHPAVLKYIQSIGDAIYIETIFGGDYSG
jgi:hypothetical protein